LGNRATPPAYYLFEKMKQPFNTLKTMAVALHECYLSFIEAGFNEADALQLTKEFLHLAHKEKEVE